MLVAAFGSRLFVPAPQTDLTVDNLYAAVVGKSSLLVEAKDLAISDGIIALVGGRGRITVRSQSLRALEAGLGALGGGQVALTTSSAFHVANLAVSANGGGSLIHVATPPPDPSTTPCDSARITVARGGTVDLADVPSVETKVKIARPAQGVARVRARLEKLTIDSPTSATDIYHIGELPSQVDYANSSLVQLTGVSDEALADLRREWDASVDLGKVAVPTIEAAFETAVALDTPHEGWFWPAMAPTVRSFLPV